MMNKDAQSITAIPLEIRQLFHKSITNFLKEKPKTEPNKDWQYHIKDDDLGLAYTLFYFHDPIENDPNIGFMVVARVRCYDVEKKEYLPDENDKMAVFRFKTLDDLLCQTNQS